MVLTQKLHEAFKGTVERITGPRTVSAFKEKGVLSVSEFVTAGDNLVAKCPTWSWESGDPGKRKPYLPPEKQFLITRNVPCLRRAASVEEEYEAAGGEVLLDDEDNDGWLATHGKPKETKSDEDENLPSMESLEISKKGSIKQIHSYMGAEEGEDIPDMAEFDDTSNVENDPATLQSTYLVAHEPDDDNILRTRTYDVSITYDKYYQTPRVWLTGYDESRMLLQPELVLEDVSQDHARKTVTIEDHPHLPGKHASIHPCRHGAVMKKIIDVLMSRGVEPENPSRAPSSSAAVLGLVKLHFAFSFGEIELHRKHRASAFRYGSLYSQLELMDQKAGDDSSSVKKIISACDVEALKKCLEENKGDYVKCHSQIEAFKSSCSLKKPNPSLDSASR
ncbi:Autophagy-related protein 3 [Glycine soja]|nr:Autophagy-related protein 3 [Glycine soja]